MRQYHKHIVSVSYVEVVVSAMAHVLGDCGSSLSQFDALPFYPQDWSLYTDPREIFEVLSWLESWYVLGIKKIGLRN